MVVRELSGTPWVRLNMSCSLVPGLLTGEPYGDSLVGSGDQGLGVRHWRTLRNC